MDCISVHDESRAAFDVDALASAVVISGIAVARRRSVPIVKRTMVEIE